MNPKFKVTSDGFFTIAELDGKVIGKGIQKLEFVHEAGQNPRLAMELDLHDFCFLPDGEYEKSENALTDVVGQRTGLHRAEASDK